MKRLMIVLIEMSLSAYLFFISPVMATPIFNTLRIPGSLTLGMTGYYLQPTATNGDLDYARLNYDAFTANLLTIRPRYDWGWGINAGYLLPCTQSDLNLSYFHLDTNTKNCVCNSAVNITPVTNIFNFPLSDPSILNPIYNYAVCSRVRYNIDQVSFTLGQFINFGCRFSVHPMIGLRWLQLERSLITNYVQATTVDTTSTIVQTQDVNFTEKSRYQGIGPLAGIDTTYCIGCGFNFVGHFNTALVVGGTRTHVNEIIQQSIIIPDVVADLASDSVFLNNPSKSSVVPIIDLKLGVNYTWIFDRYCHKALTLEVGWMCANYFNVVNREHTLTLVQNSEQGGGINSILSSFVDSESCPSDVGLQGPYISVAVYL